MNHKNSNRAVVFIVVFSVIAILESGAWNYWRQRSAPQQATTIYSPNRPTEQQQTEIDNAAAMRKAAQDVAAERARYLARYLNPGFSRKPGQKMVALVIVSEGGHFNRQLNEALAHRFKRDFVEINTSLFRQEFVTDGLFNQLLTGDQRIVNNLELAKALDVVLLGREEVQYSSDPSLENVISANMRLEITARSIRTGDGQLWTFTANGAGFKETDARLMAEERLIKQIVADTKMSLGQ